jgi:hypothetical protein
MPAAALGVVLPAPAHAQTTISGSKTSTVVLDDTGAYPNQNPFTFDHTANVVPASGDGVYGNNAKAWTITNGGSIDAANGNGIHFAVPNYSGTVSNLGTGVIIGGTHGVYINGPFGSVANQGTIIGQTSRGVQFSSAGTVLNQGSAALIYGAIQGVRMAGSVGADYVLNQSTIRSGIGGSAGSGVYLESTVADTVINQGSSALLYGHKSGVAIGGVLGATSSAYVRNAGTLFGLTRNGLYVLGSGTVKNVAGAIVGDYSGITISEHGFVGNYGGTIQGMTRNGVTMDGAGTVRNLGGKGLVSGYLNGVRIAGTSGDQFIYNQGLITSGSGTNSLHGIYLGVSGGPGNGTVINGGTGFPNATIYGHKSGVTIAGSFGYVLNRGTITGAGSRGVQFSGAGTVLNAGSAALIYGAIQGVRMAGSVGADYVSTRAPFDRASEGVPAPAYISNRRSRTRSSTRGRRHCSTAAKAASLSAGSSGRRAAPMCGTAAPFTASFITAFMSWARPR